MVTVSDHKDTKFWNQFTTSEIMCRKTWQLFQTTKIQNFETNSQRCNLVVFNSWNCFRPQRYKILKPIHNAFFCVILIRKLFQTTKIQNFETNSQQTPIFLVIVFTVSDHKDTKFWNQFTTLMDDLDTQQVLFQTTKIQNFETNSQLCIIYIYVLNTVSDHKDTKFWNQFTTTNHLEVQINHCFRPQRYKILKPIHNQFALQSKQGLTVSDHKDTKFWNQFTTMLFAQLLVLHCFRPQRYKILKPIHNCTLIICAINLTVSDHKDTKFWNQFTTSPWFSRHLTALFQTTKIQNFETNSQQLFDWLRNCFNCFRPQRYKILKPIHNNLIKANLKGATVSDHKDTKFWNQFTTPAPVYRLQHLLFQTTKIQNFETNSQRFVIWKIPVIYCFRPQRYKILKPIHNTLFLEIEGKFTVSDHKDTKFWNQFTTR